MRGLMMDMPLLISAILSHADAVYADQEVVTRTVEGPIVHASYSDVHRRSRQLANAMASLGIRAGDRIGSIAWNTQRHLELYYGVSGSGSIMHVMNPRLPAEELIYIVNHAADRLLFIDITFVPLIEAIAAKLSCVEAVVVMTDRAHMPDSKLDNLMCYEDLIAAASDSYDWPQFDENLAAGLCYTSGTTGKPKGVLYSHRSTVLHAMMVVQPSVGHLDEHQSALPVVPMFHVMAWGFPYACPLSGAKIVMPGAGLDGSSLFSLMDQENVTTAAGVPTIWWMLLNAMREAGRAPYGLTRTIIGGAAVPEAMIAAFDHYGVEVRQGWGMTEMSPLGSISVLKPSMQDWPNDRKLAQRAKQGRSIFGVDLEIVDEDGNAAAHDGSTSGRLLARGPWVCSTYYRAQDEDNGFGASHTDDGWLDTGDIATIDADGFVEITDRQKDLIKSGGEWISSIMLENAAVGHPDIAQCAAIARQDEKWGERPLLIAVAAEGREPDKDGILQFLSTKMAKWQVPDDIVFVDGLPLGATGKVLKASLRERYGQGA